jgi:hypothetical protein
VAARSGDHRRARATRETSGSWAMGIMLESGILKNSLTQL